MVDAQAPGWPPRCAGCLGSPPAGPTGPARCWPSWPCCGWPWPGHRVLEELQGGLVASVRREVGYPAGKDDVLAAPGVADRWQVRFCDLPAAVTLADRPEDPPPSDVDSLAPSDVDDPTPSGVDGVSEVAAVREDPLALLAYAARNDDPERWWEDLVESRRDGVGPSDAITEAMAELRTAAPRRIRPGSSTRRTCAACCGPRPRPVTTGSPWSAAPARARADARLLAGLPKRKVTATWVPWTHGRLATASGYGAGVTSPGW